MRNLGTFLIILFLVGCSAKEETATQILQKSIVAHGGDQFFTSYIQYDVDDINYELLRNHNITDFKLTRVRDTVTFVATYKNGLLQYFINDVEQAEGSYAKRILNSRLEGFVYTSSFPFVLNQNAVQLKRTENVIIRKTEYLAVQVSFTKIENQPENQFILYIDPETYLISFMAENYEYSAQLNLFKRFYNHRDVNGIMFSDYYSFKSPSDSISLNELYRLYDIAILKDDRSIKFENITVNYLEDNNE